VNLLRLARLPQETQEAIVTQLVSGGMTSVIEAERALNADAVAADSTPDTRRRPQRQILEPQSTGVELDGEDRDTLLHTLVVRLKQSSAIAHGQIAGRPAADVMAERLAALPGPEIVLLAGLVTRPMQVTVEAWMAAVRAEVQDEDHHFDGVMPHDCSDDSANDPDGPLTSIDDHDETSTGSVSAAHASIGDKACQGGKLTNAAVTAERGDDGADAEVRANGDQLPWPWSDKEQPPIEQALPPQEEEKPSTQEPPPAPAMPAWATDRKSPPARPRTRLSKAKGLAASTMEELTEPVPGASDTFAEIPGSADVADPMEPCSPEVQAAGDVAAPATQNDRCGWCGSTEVSPLDSTQGRIHCKACYAVYHPQYGCWDPGERDKEQRPPVSVPVTNCTIQGEIERGPSEATPSSTTGNGAPGDEVTVHKMRPADPPDDGETNERECRKIA
jgi:hypothetical protein